MTFKTTLILGLAAAVLLTFRRPAGRAVGRAGRAGARNRQRDRRVRQT